MPFLPARLVGDRHHDRDVAVLAAGDELLDAVEHVVVAVARAPWCAAPTASLPTCGSVRQNAPSSSPRASGVSQRFFCASLRERHQDRVHRAVGDADDGRGAAVAGGDLLEHQRERQVVEARRRRTPRAPRCRRRPARPGPVQLLAREVVLAVPARRRSAPGARCAKARTASRIIWWSSVRTWQSRHGFVGLTRRAACRRGSGSAPCLRRRRRPAMRAQHAGTLSSHRRGRRRRRPCRCCTQPGMERDAGAPAG